MTGHDAMDQRLHDYLDGRLSEPERKDFEARLKRDPELAASAEFLWRLRRVLQESPSDLPTGFLARARARFDESRAVRRFRPRWVSWEVAGLAAAALVVAAILIPYYRYYRLWPTSSAPEEASRLSPPAAPLSDLEKEAPLDKVEALREKKQEEKNDRPVGAGAPWYGRVPEKPKPKTHAEEASSRPKPVPEEVLARNEAAPSSQQEPVGAGTRALMESRESGAPTQLENRRQNVRKDAVDEQVERPVAAPAPSPLLKTVVGRMGSEQIPRVESLPANSLPPESLHIVRAASDPVWRELLSGPAAGPLRQLHPDFEHEYVVLIGPLPTPFSCKGLGVAYEARTARIRLVPPGAGESGASGCAVVVPADTSHVKIVTPSHE